MTSLYLLRHGETAASRDGVFSGRIDPPLTSVGEEMARAFADAYAGAGWTEIVSSPRVRARATAAPIAARAGLEVRVDDDLDEMSYGAWDGLRSADVARDLPDLHRAWRTGEIPAAPGGETADEVAARVLRAVDRARALPGDARVLFVSHKNAIRITVAALLGVPVDRHRDRFEVGACTVTRLELGERGARLHAFADRSHLPPHLRDVDPS